LTDAELRIMRALWELGSATVNDTIACIGRHDATAPVPAYNSVLTILGILERKGYVTHKKEGRAFTFQPTVDRTVARKSALANVLSKFFDGSPSLLILDLFGNTDLDRDELARLRALLTDTEDDYGQAAHRRRS
jgi:predicted transcriptional regulator